MGQLVVEKQVYCMSYLVAFADLVSALTRMFGAVSSNEGSLAGYVIAPIQVGVVAKAQIEDDRYVPNRHFWSGRNCLIASHWFRLHSLQKMRPAG